MRRQSDEENADREDSDDTDELAVEPPLPPDGGYGWVILFASFICNMIVDGVCFTFGIFYLEFLPYYGESSAKTSWVGSVLNGMYLSMGPIVSALANKFGCRAVVIAGSLLASFAYILSTFSTNVDMLILTYGVLGGMGFGLMYLPAIVIVGFYFDRRRALATGVAVCGSGIGAFVFAPLCESLITMYSWKGAAWVMAGLILNGVVMGALFRPLEGTMKLSKKKRKTEENNAKSDKLDKNNLAGKCSANGKLVSGGDHGDASLNNKMADAEDDGHALIVDTEDVSLRMRSLQNLAASGKTTCGARQLYLRSMSKSADDLAGVSAKTLEEHDQLRNVRRPIYRKDIFYSGSLARLPEYNSSHDMHEYVRSVTDTKQETSDGATSPGVACRCLRMCKSLTDTLRQMMDFSLLSDPVFCVYGLSCFLCMTGFFVPFIYLPNFAILAGVPRDQAVFLISIIGIANTIARVITGWISDQRWADCLVISNSALIVGGVVTIICPFVSNYVLLCSYAVVYGSCIAAFVSLRSIIMVDLMGLDKLTNAFGLVTMCQGMSSFIGAPIAGALFDATGNYKYSFYVAGATLVLAGLISLPLRRLAAWHKRRTALRSGVDASQYVVVLS